MEPGEFATRGGIVDVFPSGEAEPVRLDLFGDTVESIRRFDPRRSAAPARQDAAGAAAGLRGARSIRTASAASAPAGASASAPRRRSDPIYQAVSDGRRHPGIEHWVPLFHDAMETLLDYLPGASVSLDHQADEVLAARLEMIADHAEARTLPAARRRGAVPPAAARALYLDRDDWDAMLARLPVLAFSPFAKPDGADGHDAGGRPGIVFARSRRPGSATACSPAAGPGRQVGREAAALRRRRLDPRLARAHRHPAARARARGRGHRRLGRRSRRCSPARRAADARPGARLLSPDDGSAVVGEQDLLGERISRPPRRASAPTSSSPRPPRSPRATWSCTRITASAATTGWRQLTVGTWRRTTACG